MKKKLRLILFILCSLILLLVFATLLLPSKGQVVRATTINAPDSVVLHELTSLKSYSHWFPWIAAMEHPDIIYYGDDGQPLKGFSFKSEGKNPKYGRFELQKIQGDSIVRFNLHFQDMRDLYGAYLLKAQEGRTIVVWKLNMDAGWTPWWRFYAAILNKITKPALDAGLSDLKKVCESATESTTINQNNNEN